MVFPIGDDNTDRRTFPVVNIALIVANILVFVVFQGVGQNEAFTMSFSAVPEEIITGKDIVTLERVEEVPTLEGPQKVQVPGLGRTPIPVYFTLLTSIFMHGGIAHLAGNMWFLWIFGDNIEDDMGRPRYLAFYLLCGLIASLAHVFVSAGGPQAQIPSLGASGAISAVLGAYLLLHPARRVTVLMFRVIMNVPGWVAVGIWFAFQIISSMAQSGSGLGGVAYAAHIGGFIAGAVLAKPFMLGRPPPRRDRPPPQPAGW
jgi:membrane associated rhomboid family serine protease